MKFHNWFRIVWWVGLALSLSVFLYRRLPDLVAGRANALDIFVFVVWAALLLAPIFQEVAFFGMSLKQEIKEAKNDLRAQLLELRADIRNTVDVHPNINVYPPPPPPDASLPKLEERAKRIVREQRMLREPVEPQLPRASADAPESAKYLFSVRYTIERELRRLLRLRLPNYDPQRPLTAFQMMRVLIESQLLEPELGTVIREVLAVCSPAIHGEDVSEAKRNFVADVAPELIETLQSLA
jgi:hypothetical protein